MTPSEATQIADYLDSVCDHVPAELSDLTDVISFVIIDLRSFARFNKQGKHFEHAVIFAKSIPQFDDFESEEFAKWVLHDEAYIDYITRTNL